MRASGERIEARTGKGLFVMLSVMIPYLSNSLHERQLGRMWLEYEKQRKPGRSLKTRPVPATHGKLVLAITQSQLSGNYKPFDHIHRNLYPVFSTDLMTNSGGPVLNVILINRFLDRPG
jgi:hypothetical protein